MIKMEEEKIIGKVIKDVIIRKAKEMKSLNEQSKELKLELAQADEDFKILNKDVIHQYNSAVDEFNAGCAPIKDFLKAIEEQKFKIIEELQEDGVKYFKETNEKNIHEGINIRETTKVEYDDKKAFDYAKEHNIFIQLDVKGFEKFAKITPLDFVAITKNPLTTFSKEFRGN